jgi:hypothetical protein
MNVIRLFNKFSIKILTFKRIKDKKKRVNIKVKTQTFHLGSTVARLKPKTLDGQPKPAVKHVI